MTTSNRSGPYSRKCGINSYSYSGVNFSSPGAEAVQVLLHDHPALHPGHVVAEAEMGHRRRRPDDQGRSG